MLADKCMETIFWNTEGCILVDFLLKGETINTACYVQTLRKVSSCSLIYCWSMHREWRVNMRGQIS